MTMGAPAGPNAPAEDPRPEHARIKSAGYHGGHHWNQGRRVLVIRVNHNHDIGLRCQSETVTSLLVRSVSAIFWMNFDLNAIQCPRNLCGFVPAGIVYHNDKIDNALRHDLVKSALKD